MGLNDEEAAALGIPPGVGQLSPRLARLFRGAAAPPERLPSAVLGEAADERKAKRRGGRKARQAGVASEALVEIACQVYADRGAAVVQKLEPRVAPAGKSRSGSLLCQIVGKAPVDFQGTLRGGRAIAFELKSSGSASLPLETHGKPTLRPEQAKALEAHARMGALVGVLVRVQFTRNKRKVPDWYWLPWSGWQAATASAVQADRASLGRDVLAEHGCRLPELIEGAPDFLTVLGAE